MENWFFMDLKMIFLAIYRNLSWFILCGYHKELGTSKSVVRTKQLRGRRMRKKKKKRYNFFKKRPIYDNSSVINLAVTQTKLSVFFDLAFRFSFFLESY